MQNAPAAQQQPSADLAAQIRAQVRQQVEEAQRTAQEAVRTAMEQSQSGAPTTLVPPQPPPVDVIPPQAVDIVFFFFVTVAVIIIGLPIARAIGRRLDRKPYKQQIDPAMAEQLQRIENTVESMSIEIERISEAQRYMARLQTERGEPASLPRHGAP